jgi:uncharacterized protein YdiU (UPF0061 family)
VDDAAIDTLIAALLPLLEKRVDWTMFWRLLPALLPQPGSRGGGPTRCVDVTAGAALAALGRAVYPGRDAGLDSIGAELAAWACSWRALHRGADPGGARRADVAAAMQRVNPKYIPRQWMLVDCYVRAQEGDYALLHLFEALLTRPYDEQPEYEARFFRRAPSAMYSDLAPEGTPPPPSLYREVMPS